MKMRAEVMVQVPAGQAWALVGEAFGEIAAWAAPISASSLDTPAAPGSVRTCRIRGFGPVAPGVVRERLTRFDPAQRSLSYEAVDGLAWFIIRAVNRCSVHVHDPGRAGARHADPATDPAPVRAAAAVADTP
jgi:hypothetical protein